MTGSSSVPVRPGDRLTCVERVVGVEEREGKFSGRLATQYMQANYFNQRDELVAQVLGWCTAAVVARRGPVGDHAANAPLAVLLRHDRHTRDAREPLRQALDLVVRCGTPFLADAVAEDLLAATTGMRRSELAGVCEENLNLEAGTLDVFPTRVVLLNAGYKRGATVARCVDWPPGRARAAAPPRRHRRRGPHRLREPHRPPGRRRHDQHRDRPMHVRHTKSHRKHLGNAYRKLSITSRTELTGALAAQR